MRRILIDDEDAYFDERMRQLHEIWDSEEMGDLDEGPRGDVKQYDTGVYYTDEDIPF